MRRVRTLANIGITLVAVAALTAAGFLLRRVSQSPAGTIKLGGRCANCTVEIEKILTIEDADGEASLAEPFAVAYGNGMTYVVSQPHAIARFGAHGSFLGNLEKRGRGPGEFQGIVAIAFHQDRFHVIDRLNARYSILTPDLRLVREVPLRELYPLALGIAITSSGRTIVNGLPRGTGSNRPVLHEIDSLGTVIGSFDSVNIQQERAHGFPDADMKLVAESYRDRVWVARGDQHDVALWQLDPPKRLQRLQPRSKWFVDAARSSSPPRPGAPEPRTLAAPPPPAILGIQEDSAGLLWVIGRSTNTDWKRYSDAQGSERMKMYSFVIDVIDPKRGGEVIASAQAPFLGRFVGPQIIGTYRETADGYPTIELYRLRLRGYAGK